MPTVFAEVLVPRSVPDYNGAPTEGAWKQVICYLPPGGSVRLVRGYMKNEPGGDRQVPPKPDTDHVGDISYKRCPLERGECEIGWAAGRLLPAKCNDKGGMEIFAKFANWAAKNDRTAKLEVTYEISRGPEIYSEIIVPRTVPTPSGQPTESAWREVQVRVPANTTIASIKGYMKSEPPGGAQIPIKLDTDAMGSTDYVECPLDEGECAIKFAAGRMLPTTSAADGSMVVKARFANYFYRNDRLAKLAVIYLKEGEQRSEKKSSICTVQ